MPMRKSQISTSGLLDHRLTNPFMAIFQAFFDESGKFRDKKVISVCGLCAPPGKVQEFEDDWKALLRHHGLESLTMKRALRRKVKFSSKVKANSRDERNEVLKPFAECIKKHFEFGIAVSVDVLAYRSLPAPTKKRYGGGEDPFYFAFLTALVSCDKYLRSEDRVNIVFDDDTSTAVPSYKLYHRVRCLKPEIKRKFIAITFADDKEFIPLQGADFLSSLSRLESGRRFHREYYEYMPLFHLLAREDPERPFTWVGKFYDGDSLRSLRPGAR